MKRVFVYIVLTILALAAMGVLTGCTGFRSDTCADSDRYSAGDAGFTAKISMTSGDFEPTSH